MNYKVIDKETYYRKGVFRHFTEDCKCSTSMTARIDVTELVAYSKAKGTKFYINFLYILSKVINSRDDYKMGYLWQTDELICYDVMNPMQYVFHDDTETCTPVRRNRRHYISTRRPVITAVTKQRLYSGCKMFCTRGRTTSGNIGC